MRFFLHLLRTLLYPLLIISALLFGLIHTTPGTRLSVGLINLLMFKGALHIDHIEGKIFEKITLQGIHYRHDTLNLTIDRAVLMPVSLTRHAPWKFQLTLDSLSTPSVTLPPLHSISVLEITALNAWKLQGTMRGRYLKAPLLITFQATPAQFKAEAIWQKNTLKIQHQPHTAWHLKATLPTLNKLHPALTPLQTRVYIEGDFNNSMQGHITLRADKGSWLFPDKPPLAFSGLHTRLNYQGNGNPWGLSGRLLFAGKPILLKGAIRVFPELQGSLTLQGDALPLLNTEEYRLEASPNLALTWNPSGLTVQGTIVLPSGELTPRIVTHSVDLSDDVVFVHAQKARSGFALNLAVTVTMGQQVKLAVKGLTGTLQGSIKLLQTPESPLTAQGTLHIREGQYKAYGQHLTVENGQLVFNAGLINNPRITLRASKRLQRPDLLYPSPQSFMDFNTNTASTLNYKGNITVGIAVNGRLHSPQITLFSIPPLLSQADTLSYLLLGKPASEASQAGGQLLLQAITAMNLNKGSRGLELMNQLKNKLGLDFNLENTSLYNQKTHQTTETTRVVVSKKVNKRLSMRYNLGLGQNNVNVFTLNYLLNTFFSLQMNASTLASGIDLLYTRSGISPGGTGDSAAPS